MGTAIGTVKPDVEQRPGDFRRHPNGAPYVSDPTGAVTKDGTPRWLMYGRPSGFAKQIEDTFRLGVYGERMTLLGADGLDREHVAALIRDREADPAGIVRDANGYTWKDRADALVLVAKDIAKAGLAADRGTHTHKLTEEHDAERDWIVLAERGELLGIPVAAQHAAVHSWQAFLDRYGFEVLATEATIVHDLYRLAGTLDRIVRLTKPIHFGRVTTSGKRIVLPAGTVLVLDIKTGRLGIDRGYWQGYAPQIAAYAGGLPYDTESNTRSVWRWPVSQVHGLIAHLDVAALIAGELPDWQLFHVDLTAAAGAAKIVLDAKAWAARRDVFTPHEPDEEPPAAPVDDFDTPQPVGAVKQNGWLRVSQQQASEAHAMHRAAATDAALRTMPDEGADLSTPEDRAGFDTLERQYAELDAAGRTWITSLARGARKNGCNFHAAERRTVRRFEILRALVRLCQVGGDNLAAVRALAALAMGTDTPLDPTIDPGHAIGALDATEAATFAQLTDEFIAGTLTATVDNDGTLRLTRAT